MPTKTDSRFLHWRDVVRVAVSGQMYAVMFSDGESVDMPLVVLKRFIKDGLIHMERQRDADQD